MLYPDEGVPFLNPGMALGPIVFGVVLIFAADSLVNWQASLLGIHGERARAWLRHACRAGGLLLLLFGMVALASGYVG